MKSMLSKWVLLLLVGLLAVASYTPLRFNRVSSITHYAVRNEDVKPMHRVSERRVYSKINEKSASNVLRMLQSKRLGRIHAEKSIIQLIGNSSQKNGAAEELTPVQWKLLHSCAVNYRLHKIATVIVEMMLNRSISCSSTAITEHVNLLCSKGAFNEALLLLDTLQDHKQQVSLSNFVAALRWSGSVDRAWSILQRMEYAGIPLNVISFTSAIKSCEFSGDWTGALEMLDLMRLNGIQPNEITYTVIISVMAKCRLGEIAFVLLRDMIYSGIEVNSVVYGSTISALARSNMWNEVELLLNEMHRDGIEISKSVLNSAITACRDEGFYYQRFDAKQRIGVANFTNTMSDYENWSRELYQHKLYPTAVIPADDLPRWQRARLFLDRWIPYVNEDKQECIVMVMEIMQNYGQHEEVINMFWSMLLDYRDVVSRAQINMVMHSCMRARDAVSAVKLLHVARQNNEDTPSLYNTSLLLCYRSNRYDDAIFILHQAIESAEQRSNTSSLTHLPPIWLIEKVISIGLNVLTRNFTSYFTEVIDGRLMASANMKPYVDSLTASLRWYVMTAKQAGLPATGIPMANKLLLDCGDYDAARSLLNETLYKRDVNSTSLYDFALRSITRTTPSIEELNAGSAFIDDLCRSNFSTLAASISLKICQKLSLTLVQQVENNNVNGTETQMFNSSSEKQRQMQGTAANLFRFFNHSVHHIFPEFFPESIYMLLAETYRHAGMLERMIAVHECAIERNVLNKRLINLLACSVARSPQHWPLAIQVVDLFNGNDTADHVTYKSALLACETGAACDQSLSLLQRMQDSGYELCALSINAAISACARHGRLDDVMRLLDLMTISNIPPNYKSFRYTMQACAKQSRWHTALKVYEIMHESLPLDGSDRYQANLKIDTRYFQTLYERSRETSGAAAAFVELIEVLGDGQQHLLIDDMYAEAIRHSVVNPFLKIDNAFLDLHQHSEYMAAAALRYFFQNLMKISQLGLEGAEKQAEFVESVTDVERKFVEFLSRLDNIPEALLDPDVAAQVYEGQKDQLGLDSTDNLYLIIIIRKGKRLENTVERFLKNELSPPLRCFKSKSSKGRLLVPLLDILIWLTHKFANAVPQMIMERQSENI